MHLDVTVVPPFRRLQRTFVSVNKVSISVSPIDTDGSTVDMFSIQSSRRIWKRSGIQVEVNERWSSYATASTSDDPEDPQSVSLSFFSP